MPTGEPGQVWVKDPGAERFKYWGDPKKTKRAWREGSFSVGDLGRLDDDLYLYLTGRKDDTIITGGVNVYPQEVERALVEHDDIADALVYGWPNEEWGQEVRALVVPAEEATPDSAEITLWLREQIAHFKCPRVIEFVGQFERTPTGKPRRPRPPIEVD
jgi:acyl-CoA synthetase (AMP-forming)/AMP-acid ligase II